MLVFFARSLLLSLRKLYVPLLFVRTVYIKDFSRVGSFSTGNRMWVA